MIIPNSSALANVRVPLMGSPVGNKGGNTTITGRGAGGEPTGVAVLSDVVQIARAMVAGGNSLTPFGYVTWQPATLAATGETTTATYLR